MEVERDPVVLCAPEGEQVAREMSVWDDVRMLPDFLCVTVPDTIDYPQAHYTSFQSLAEEIGGGINKKLGIVGMDAMPASLLRVIEDAFQS